ncbi:hypothetical protein EUX98_g2855 [Antrodiella citrinella]|uniref:PH domain-containing protein n=1 Tax=Antrodiella citrinella TaxID=2447956 RepID=A0A4S4MZC7_9APHY|nr:hypothetical protein EUX98_g2855 [Antrodiella citrinella]
MPACNTPTALHTGPLLYLCRPVSPNDLPVWTDCTVVLHPSHILVTWLTPQDNPSTSMVTLPQCTDVRSLAVNELDAEERGLLPTQPNKGELKVFELLFEGRVREKFAAYSVTERAGWVSAIWDALLLCQDRKSQLSSPANDAPFGKHFAGSPYASDAIATAILAIRPSCGTLRGSYPYKDLASADPDLESFAEPIHSEPEPNFDG